MFEIILQITMYGLLLEGIYSYLRVVFGEETLTKVRQKANITHSGFDSFRVSICS